MDIDTVADELYALRPEDFTAARNTRMAAARTAGDRALAEKIGKLRRPSLAAWVSNLLVRERPEEVQALLRLGEGLRRAHHDLDGGQLRELSGQQKTLIRALSREAGQLAAQAGHPVGEDVGREVEATLHAVLADPEAAEEWAKGRLVRPFEAIVGFPDVSPSAVRRAATPPPPTPRPAKRRDDEALDRARRDADTAVRDLRALEDEAAEAGREHETVQERTAQLQHRVSELTEELSRVEGDHRQAREEQRQAREKLRAVERRVREARRRADAATARLERHQG
ncbi:hypothetical protein OHT76_01950 [Streptomyces sp. NBC_00287]|uniref:hypothetical protein n=1 Tax=Streptomyces sp. NBC_00287 TaxID=2975702 RepID=UPI002E2CF8D7|nr:hypothetical protein [Streptomyces sp. NBC_00287]